MIREIIIWPDPVLARPCEEVTEINNDVLRLLDDMVETMIAAGGAGLAAPQVGFNLRLVTLMVETPLGDDEKALPGHPRTKFVPVKLINPRILEHRGLQRVREGCLSFPNYFDMMQRASHVVAEALDETGARLELSGDGRLAQALQHELEHLDGLTIADHLSQLKKELLRHKLVKAKKHGMRYKFDRPEPQDFTARPS